MTKEQREIIKNLDLTNVNNIEEYFFLLRKTFSKMELIDILGVGYSSYYRFYQELKKGNVMSGVVYRTLVRLYTFTKTGVYNE